MPGFGTIRARLSCRVATAIATDLDAATRTDEIEDHSRLSLRQRRWSDEGIEKPSLRRIDGLVDQLAGGARPREDGIAHHYCAAVAACAAHVAATARADSHRPVHAAYRRARLTAEAQEHLAGLRHARPTWKERLFWRTLSSVKWTEDVQYHVKTATSSVGMNVPASAQDSCTLRSFVAIATQTAHARLLRRLVLYNDELRQSTARVQYGMDMVRTFRAQRLPKPFGPPVCHGAWISRCKPT